MAKKGISVNFKKSPPRCRPNRATLKKGEHDAIVWTAKQTGYTFTGVEIEGIPAPTGDFGTPVIDDTGDSKPLSVMTVTDACSVPAGKNYIDHEYTLLFTAPDGTALTADPRIRHRK